MACGGCDARREWALRKARLAAETLATLLKLAQPKKPAPPAADDKK